MKTRNAVHCPPVKGAAVFPCGNDILPGRGSSADFNDVTCGLCRRCRATVSERFWAKVNKNGPMILDTPCWEWTGAQINSGYGHIWVNKRYVNSNRFSYALAYGPITRNTFVLHHCDNKRCVNPKHLFPGDNFINRRDCRDKGRLAQAKLTWEKVEQIRRRSADGESKNTLAKEFGIHPTTIGCVVRGKTWKFRQPTSRAASKPDESKE